MNSSSFAAFTACFLAGAASTFGCASTDGNPSSDNQNDPGGADADVADTSSASDATTGPADAGHADAPHDAPRADQSAPDAKPPPPPPPPPPPTTLDLHDVTIYDNPPNLADWPVTTLITAVEFQYQGIDGVRVEFSKRDGAGSWPDVTPPGWDGPLEYTVGIVEKINGQWYGSAAIEFWRDLKAAGGNVASDPASKAQCTVFGLGSACQVAKNWYYDGRWGQLAGYQPATGETIGIFVAAGNLRGVTDGSQSPVQERSNVVLMPMPALAGGRYTF